MTQRFGYPFIRIVRCFSMTPEFVMHVRQIFVKMATFTNSFNNPSVVSHTFMVTQFQDLTLHTERFRNIIRLFRVASVLEVLSHSALPIILAHISFLLAVTVRTFELQIFFPVIQPIVIFMVYFSGLIFCKAMKFSLSMLSIQGCRYSIKAQTNQLYTV